MMRTVGRSAYDTTLRSGKRAPMSPPGPVRRPQYPAGVRCEKRKPLHRLCVLVIDRQPPALVPGPGWLMISTRTGDAAGKHT
jgi:hypothetical protein